MTARCTPPNRCTAPLASCAVTAAFTLLLSACASSPDEGQATISGSERASLQGECVKIADRTERTACLERAAFDPTW